MIQLFKDRNFLIFWIGELVSVIGDHISLIAFPWLVLQMTGSPAMTGLVFAAQGLPRAVLMLAGGAVVDRTSPRAVMLATNWIRCALVMTLAYMIFTDTAGPAFVFVIALAFGIADAFFYPASTSIIPSLVKPEQLQAGNAVVHMTAHLAVALGPIIAGLVIAGEIGDMSHGAAPVPAADTAGGYQQDRPGLARAFFLDGLTFAVSGLTLALIRTRSLKQQDANGEHDGQETAETTQTTGSVNKKTSMFRDVVAVMRHIWAQPPVRLCFIGIMALEFFYQAPIFVGLPALAKERFLDGARIYGLEIGAWGMGAFIGSLLGGMVRPIPPKWLPRAMFAAFIFSGATLGMVAYFEAYQVAMVLFFCAGLGDSFVWIQFISWLQRITPGHMMGRVMSMLMFMAIGLLPVANMAMGLLFELHVTRTMYGASLAIITICLIAVLHPDARKTVPPLDSGKATGTA